MLRRCSLSVIYSLQVNKEDRRVLPALSDIPQGEPDETYDDEGKLSNML
jgi:hypothetical protein